MGKITIIGTGMDGAATLTCEARAAVESAEVLMGAERMLEPFAKLGKRMFSEYRAEELARLIEENESAEICVLMSGDSGFFSGTERLVKLLGEHGISPGVIPGISSLSYFAAKIGKPWQSMKIVNLHGNGANIARAAARNSLCFFLLGGENTPNSVCRRLCEYGLGGLRVRIGGDLAYPTERIVEGTAQSLCGTDISGLCVMATENNSPERGVRFGIPDEEFIRGSVPMTKTEVRSVIMSKLRVPENGVCWDLGCGTGSVSVEMALACHEGTVYSVDRSEEAVSLTITNALKFRCDNIRAVLGEIPEALSALPAPDSVFIGGASGRIGAVLNEVYSRDPRAAVTATAVSLETLNEAIAAFGEHGISPQIVQTAAARAKRLGSHTMLSAENPIFIISATPE